MLSLLQVQTIIAQCIRQTTGGTPVYSRSKTFGQMSILSPVQINGFVFHVYQNPRIGLLYHHHRLLDDAFDGLNPNTKISAAEDILLTAQPLAGRVRNPIF